MPQGLANGIHKEESDSQHRERNYDEQIKTSMYDTETMTYDSRYYFLFLTLRPSHSPSVTAQLPLFSKFRPELLNRFQDRCGFLQKEKLEEK